MSDAIASADGQFSTVDSAQGLVNAPRQPLSLVYWATCLAMIDVVGITLIALAAFHFSVAPYGYDIAKLWTGLIYFIPAWFMNSWLQGLYSYKHLISGARQQTVRALMTCILAFGTVLFAGVALDGSVGMSRAWLLTWALSSSLWISGLRLAWTYCFRTLLRRGACLDRVLVMADTRRHALELGDKIESESRGQIAVMGGVAFPGMPGGLPIDWVEDTIRDGVVDRVVITRFENSCEHFEVLLARLMRLAVDVTMIPDLAELPAPVKNVHCIGALPALSIASRPLTAIQAALKRTEDLGLTCLLGFVLLPMGVVIALAIKIDSPGPVLFGQMREGYHGRAFRLWKFRTMFHNVRDEACALQTSRQDNRVTRIGRILRRLSLDELPQFINVILGEMSVVGPRPHALGMTSLGLPMDRALEHYSARYRLKPGITGLAQVNGCRGEINSHEKLRRRVSLDCYYIDHWSIALDVFIILRTVIRLPFDSGAY